MNCSALKWENNETEEEIFDTTSVLETEIDISVIYKYEGDNSVFTNYRLVSMVRGKVSNFVSVPFKFPLLPETSPMFNVQVCLCGDLYNCVAYENKRWVRHFCTEIEVKLRHFVIQEVTRSVTSLPLGFVSYHE